MKYYIGIVFLLSLFNFHSNADELTYTQNDSSGNNLALGYPVPMPVDTQLPFEGFRSYQSLLDRHQDLAIQSSNVAANVIGTTFSGRTIWSFSYSDPNSVTNEGFPEAGTLHQGAIHAREWSTPEAVSGIMETLFANQNDAGFHQYLLENLNMVFTPVVNVDGFLQTQRNANKAQQTTFPNDPASWPRDGRMRRKNMRGVDEVLSTTGDLLLGVDLNRNNLPFWATTTRSSSDNRSLVHHGSFAASEPEIQAMQAAAALVPESRLRFYIDNHSFSQIYFTPMTGNTRRDNITSNVVANMRQANLNKYRFGPSTVNSGIGATDGYFAFTYQIPSYTLETEPLNGATDYGGFGVSHDGFILPEAEVSRMKTEISAASLIGYYQQAGAPVVSAIEIRDTADDTVVFAGNWQRLTDKSREWIETINLSLTVGNTYRLWLAFNKPMRWLNNSNELQSYPNISQLNSNNRIILAGLDDNNNRIEQALQITDNHWLNNSGGAPAGYLNYQGDSLSLEFTLDSELDATQLKRFAVEVEATDLSRQKLDADPTTVLDWINGAWDNYEDSDGNLTDNGGIDRSIRIKDDGADLFVIDPPPTTPPPVTPPPVTPPQTPSSGGGGSLFWMLLFLSLRFCFKTNR